jgi:RNA polymerase sigma factor (sigma-70 family)
MLKQSLNYSDRELVNAIKTEKDINPAIRFIYQQYSQSVSSFITANGGSEQDGEDIFQEVVVAFINIIKNGKYRGDATVKTFLVSISKNIWYNEIKRRQRAGNREKIFEYGKETKEDDISMLIGDREVKQQFRELLNKLGDSCKKILVLFYYENMSMKEMLGVLPYENEQVVRNKKYKCLQQLMMIVKENPLIIEKIK